MKNNGFSLAEVLITLALLGVIGAILFPVISKTPPNMEMVLYKKAFSTVGRAAEELLSDEALYPRGNQLGLNDNSGVRYMGRIYSGNTKFCGLLAAKLDAMSIDGANICPTFRTQDGVHYSVNGLNVTVDVLGDKCNPVRSGCQNIRIFGIAVDANGGVTPVNPNAGLAQQYLDETNISRRQSEFN